MQPNLGLDKHASLGDSSNANVEMSEAQTTPQNVAEVELPAEVGPMSLPQLFAWLRGPQNNDHYHNQSRIHPVIKRDLRHEIEATI